MMMMMMMMMILLLMMMMMMILMMMMMMMMMMMPQHDKNWQNVREKREKLGLGNVPRPAWIIWWKLSWYFSSARQPNFNTFLSCMALRGQNWTWGRTWALRTWGLKWSTTQWFCNRLGELEALNHGRISESDLGKGFSLLLATFKVSQSNGLQHLEVWQCIEESLELTSRQPFQVQGFVSLHFLQEIFFWRCTTASASSRWVNLAVSILSAKRSGDVGTRPSSSTSPSCCPAVSRGMSMSWFWAVSWRSDDHSISPMHQPRFAYGVGLCFRSLIGTGSTTLLSAWKTVITSSSWCAFSHLSAGVKDSILRVTDNSCAYMTCMLVIAKPKLASWASVSRKYWNNDT